MTVTIESLHGRVGDLDSHEAIPAPRYPEIFGEIGRRFLTENEEMWRRADMITIEDPQNRLTVDHTDDAPIKQQTVWEMKGTTAPGAIDMNRRPAVMDEMGIQRQLVFPMMGILAWIQALGGGQTWMPVASKEQVELGHLAVREYNNWAGRLTSKYPARMSIVGILSSGQPGLTPKALVKKAEELIDSGVKAIMISAGKPPAGLAPGDLTLDPFYATLAKANVALVFHPPSGLGFRSSEVWESSLLHPLYAGVTIGHAAERNYLAIMVMSGVFDRHPTLRVAFVEQGADWIGPLAEHMDHAVSRHWGTVKVDSSRLSMKPSEFLSRNVRVSVMVDEPVEVWLERHPQIQNVYCYSSDYPHVEGGPWSLKRLYERVVPLGDDIVEKFFVTNSQLVLPVQA